ncbi:hypothetical protein PInf_016490 [Phytophthora infestans]|nr:hypothetical protein PInf_016490 [Phytophthora infestans]
MSSQKKKRKQPMPDEGDSDLDLFDEDSDVEPTEVTLSTQATVSSGVDLAIAPSMLGKTFDSWGRIHNHVTNETIYTALKQCKDLVSDSVLSMLDAFGHTNTETKQIASYVADSLGLPVSTQQIRNLKSARLGSLCAEDRLKAVPTDFAADESNKCDVLQGEWDQTIGIVLQTNAQKQIVSRWGDTLALDWTHNCTNLGFYVGNV